MKDAEWAFGQKNNWRRRMWNRIASTVKMAGRRPKDAVCLFLAGTGLMDVAVAEEKGFRRRNLIAVTLEEGVRDECRFAKVPCIMDSLPSIVACWPEHTPLDAIYADYYSGYSWQNHVTLLSALMCTDGIRRDWCGLVVSLQRGRETGRCLEMIELAKAKHVTGAWTGDDNHRGPVFACRLLVELAHMIEVGAILRNADVPVGISDLQFARSWIPGIVYDTYRSEPVTMDSVFMQLSFPFPPQEIHKSGMLMRSNGDTFDMKSAERKIPAALAVRTRLSEAS